MEWMRQTWSLPPWAHPLWGGGTRVESVTVQGAMPSGVGVGMSAGAASPRVRVAGGPGALPPPARVAPSGLCPQVDELYEGYCIQCRLRDGASNMQRAFSRCPPSRASRESLQELGRSLQECTEVGAGAGGWGGPRGRWLSAHGPLTAGSVRSPAANPGPAASALCGALQDMWLIEGALEVHLGEFHIRMKGNELSRGRGQSGWGFRTSGAPGLLLRVKGWSDSQWSRPSPGFPFV